MTSNTSPWLPLLSLCLMLSLTPASHANDYDLPTEAEYCSAYIKDHQYDRAVTACEKAVEIAPTDSLLLNNLGLAYMEGTKKRPDWAERALNKAIEADSNQFRAYYNLGLLYLSQGDAEKALPILEQGKRLCPTEQQWGFASRIDEARLMTKHR